MLEDALICLISIGFGLWLFTLQFVPFVLWFHRSQKLSCNTVHELIFLLCEVGQAASPTGHLSQRLLAGLRLFWKTWNPGSRGIQKATYFVSSLQQCRAWPNPYCCNAQLSTARSYIFLQLVFDRQYGKPSGTVMLWCNCDRVRQVRQQTLPLPARRTSMLP